MIKTSREEIHAYNFKNLHRWEKEYFTRARSLPFAITMILVLRNSVKSLQNVVNEALISLDKNTVTASAYSQARYKLKHTAFIALNQKAIIETMYGDEDYQKFWGFRILAVDGSKIVLPDNEEVCDEFGTMKWTHKSGIKGKKPYATASVLYDVFNRVSLDATLGRADAYEVDLAIAHLLHTRRNDLLVMDRGYTSYRMIAELTKYERDYVIRCSAMSFQTARDMLAGEGEDSQIVTLTPCDKQAVLMAEMNLSMSLRVRFVRVTLSTGEYEVLVTSLLDEQRYPTKEFSALYWFRWEIETFYGLLKTRLDLENFTGNGVEAVRQDFYATIYLTGMESILTDAAQAQLDAKQNAKYAQVVNRSVSFNAIKYHAFALLWSNLEPEPLFEKLTALFLTSPTIQREGRNPSRKKASASKRLNFHKRKKKPCF